MELRKQTQEQAIAIYRTHLKLDFPPSEIKPLTMITDLLSRGLYSCYGLFENRQLLAYAFFVKAEQGRIWLLDYYAVCQEVRSKGYGSRCLPLLVQQCAGCSGILAEVEDPAKAKNSDDLAIRNRRIAFYLRNGFRYTKLYSALFGEPYALLYHPVTEDCPDEQLYQELDSIYHTLFSPHIYQRHVTIELR